MNNLGELMNKYYEIGMTLTQLYSENNNQNEPKIS